MIAKPTSTYLSAALLMSAIGHWHLASQRPDPDWSSMAQAAPLAAASNLRLEIKVADRWHDLPSSYPLSNSCLRRSSNLTRQGLPGIRLLYPFQQPQ
jgi:hypothetical protein